MMERGAIMERGRSGVLLRAVTVLFMMLACACILNVATMPNAYAVTDTVIGNDNNLGTVLTSSDSKVQYKITTAATPTKNGAVQVLSVSPDYTGAFAIPDTVTRLSYTYQVTSLDAAAFVNASALTSIGIPAKVACSSLYLYGCTNLQSITVDPANTSLSVGADGVLYNKDQTAIIACRPALPLQEYTVPTTVKKIGDSAFRNNTKLVNVEFAADLEGEPPVNGSAPAAIDDYAFSGCTALKSVTFPQKVAGIGDYAFSDCTALASVKFPEGAELYVTSTVQIFAVGAYSFSGCTALKSISVPAIITSERKADSYKSFEEYNPASNLGGSNASGLFTSGYMAYWHNGYGPVARGGIGGSAFSGCTLLESVVFRAGNSNGMFSYWPGGTNDGAFVGCTGLKSVIYEGAQPYFGNPNASMYDKVYRDYWGTFCAIDIPAQYYAVNYYATSDAAESDDSAGSNRLARVEYKRGTSTSDIASGNTEALADSVYADREAYAQKEADGVVPDAVAAKQAAVDAKLDTADSDKVWAWALNDTQSRREGLTDSCSAYLVEVNDISAGRIDADQITTMYKLCDQNLSQGTVQDTAFDPVRYSSDSAYLFSGPSLVLDAGETAWFTLDSSLEKSFYDKIKVRAADGTELSSDDYTITFQRYDATAETEDKLVATELGQADGPLLMTVTPSEESGYTGTLQEWVLVEGHAGSVLEQFTDSVESTWSAACYYKKNNLWNISFNSPYAVAISSADPSSALLAAGYAGLVKAPINVVDTEDDSYGFGMSTSYSPNGTIAAGSLGFSAKRDDTSATFAVKVYRSFEGKPGIDGTPADSAKRDGMGASLSQYPWGDTAVLVAPGSVPDVAASAAAYAYAKKAPVFYAEDDSSVSDDTLECLKDFSKVVVIGDATQFSGEALSAVASSLGVDIPVTRISGDTGSASALGLAVADTLASEGLASSSIVTVSDATEAADAISALNLSGHEGGLTLVSSCTADSKRINAYLRDKRDAVNTVRLYGRDASNISSDSFDFLGSLQDLWDVSGYVQPIVGAGDTLVLGGALFNVGADNTLEFTGTRLWGTAELDAGSYSYNGVVYTLAKGTGPAVDPEPNPTPDPDPTPDPGSNSKPNGSLTIGDGSQGSISVGSSGSGANPSTGTIDVSLSGADENVQPGNSGEGEAPVYADENQPSDDQGEDGDPAAGSQTSASPVAAVALIVVALGALGAALWFAMRKRNPVAVLSE